MMIKEWNMLILEAMIKDDTLTPLRKYFAWEMLNELKNAK